ncbi:MAG: dihydrofolate reductase family protein [Actinomycetota bacterium]|nr:dihydrofolate reductase family protein [Actinomycetota bacterium]
MRDLVVPAFLTLDGVMQAPGGPEEDPTGGFTQGGWSVNYWDEDMGAVMGEYFSRPFELLLGRRTYEIFAAHWPYVTEGEDAGAATVLNSARKYVASRTLSEVTWNNSVLLQGDAAEAVAALKAEDGPDIVTQGSSNLIQALLRHDLVDEFRLWTFPVVVGQGKRLFGDGTMPGGLRVVGSETSTTGVVMTTYRRAGEIPLGSFALENPTAEEVERREGPP